MHSPPDFIGIGAQKAGTTWLYKMLDAHPDIGMIFGDEKDTRFFTCFYDRGYAWYEKFYEQVRGSVKGEFSTSYFYSHDATERMFSYLHDIKIIVSLRNPIDRIISNHRHQVQLGYAIGEQEDLGIAINNNPSYLEQSLYYKHLKRWIDKFGTDKTLIILFDDIKDRPESVCKEMYRFLGVDEDFLSHDFSVVQNPTRSHGINEVEMKLKSISKLIRKIGLGSLVSYLKHTGLKQKIQKRGVQSPHVDYITQETKDSILKIVRHDIENLESLIGRDLSSWKG